MDAAAILKGLYARFPQFNPDSEEYDTEVNGGNLVDWVAGMEDEIIEAIERG